MDIHEFCPVCGELADVVSERGAINSYLCTNEDCEFGFEVVDYYARG